MKTRILALVLILFVVGCAPQLAPAPASPTFPLPVTTPTRSLPPTAEATATNPLPTSPVVGQHFALSDLPGTGHRPNAVAVLGDKVYTANTVSGNVAVIQNNRVIKFIPIATDLKIASLLNADTLVADPTQQRIYVSNNRAKTISVIVNDQVVQTQSIGETIDNLLFFEGHLLAGLDRIGTIFVIDPATLQIQSRINVPNALSILGLAGDPVHHRVYANLLDKTAVIDMTTQRILFTLNAKSSYYTVAADPSADRVWVAVYENGINNLVAFDPRTGGEKGRVKLGGDPRGVAVSTDGTRAYVANSYTNDVSVLDLRNIALVTTIPVSMNPGGLALDEKAHRLYVANYASDSVSAIDTDKNSVLATIPLAITPSAILANERAGRVYVANPTSDSVFVVEGTRVVKEIPVGHHPMDLSRDEQANRVFVANEADGTLSVINESDFTVRASQPITRFLTSVMVDSAHNRVFANNVIVDPNSLAPTGSLTFRGYTLYGTITPELIRVNPGNNRIYAVAWNGIPGSNSRQILYSIDGNTLTQRTTVGMGNVTALVIDPETNRVFTAETHPLAYNNLFTAYDADDKRLIQFPLDARTSGMIYNPQTHHLFLSGTKGYAQSYGPTPVPVDNRIEILDTTTYGRVGYLSVNTPAKMARLGNMIYVTSSEDGTITLVQDAMVPSPPAPTVTLTPTPWPSSTPTAVGATKPTPLAQASPIKSSVAPTPCAIAVVPYFAGKITSAAIARIGCPIEALHDVNFAAQTYERGTMFWREDDKRIYILYSDKTWQVFDDTWTSTQAEDSCPNTSVSPGLVKPKRGFGKVWCEQSAVRAKIGAATGNEAGYAGPVQRFERGIGMGDAQGAPIVLYNDGKWE